MRQLWRDASDQKVKTPLAVPTSRAMVSAAREGGWAACGADRAGGTVMGASCRGRARGGTRTPYQPVPGEGGGSPGSRGYGCAAADGALPASLVRMSLQRAMHWSQM